MTLNQAPGPDIFLTWSDDYCLGQRRFDQEHERLSAIIAHLHETMIVRRDTAVSLKVFDRLILETRKHFDGEVELMLEYGYPGLEAHALEHSRLLEEAQDLARKYQQGYISALALPSFLKKWLLAHIGGPDRDYVAFLKAKGF